MRGLGWTLTLVSLTSSCSLALEFDQADQRRDCNQASCPSTPQAAGSGIEIPYDSLPPREIVAGFIAKDELIVAVRVGDSDEEGAVIAVDLASGDRSLRAGLILDRQGLLHERGGGRYLAGLSALEDRGAQGWSAHLWDGFGFVGAVTQIDPESGRRASGVGVGDSCPVATSSPVPLPVVQPSVLDRDGYPVVAVYGVDYAALYRLDKSCSKFSAPEVEQLVPFRAGADVLAYGSKTANIYALPAAGDALELISTAEAGSPRILAATGGNSELWLLLAGAPVLLQRVERVTGKRSNSLPVSGDGTRQPTRKPDLFFDQGRGLLLAEFDGAIVSLDTASGRGSLLSY